MSCLHGLAADGAPTFYLPMYGFPFQPSIFNIPAMCTRIWLQWNVFYFRLITRFILNEYSYVIDTFEFECTMASTTEDRNKIRHTSNKHSALQTVIERKKCTYVRTYVNILWRGKVAFYMLWEGTMEQISIKTPNPKCRIFWCLIEFIDWRYSQSWWYFRPLL
jgi:hypothetical protein